MFTTANSVSPKVLLAVFILFQISDGSVALSAAVASHPNFVLQYIHF